MTLKDHHNEIFIKTYKTNIFPLRWFADLFCHKISMVFFNIGLKANDKSTYDWEHFNLFDEIKEKIGWRMYRIFDYPYTKWGTYYVFDSSKLKELREEMHGPDWDDYDKNGIPYWDYLWSNDEETGDGWRIVLKDK